VSTLAKALDVTAEARNYNAWLLDRARPYLRGRILDAGAGLGTFTEILAAAGHEVVALEPDPEFVSELRRRFTGRPNVTVLAGALETVDGEFDSIVCFNVLEHIRDDELALRNLRERLAPDGCLLLLVPAHPLLLGDTDRLLGHHRRYERKTLAALLAGVGYKVVTLRHVNPLGALGWLLWFRLRGPPRGGWPAGAYRFYDRLVPVLRPLDRLRLPVGLSLWAAARRGG
jgi:2-polyprenyl-3-methyl-5-hydroxy-6-metoxy-1,4-benzoquinol methylase